MLLIKQTRSPIGTRKEHRATLRTLGLRKIGQTVEKADSGSVRGMLRSIAHLVSFEEVADTPPPEAATPAKPAKPVKKAAATQEKPVAKTKRASAKSTATKKATTTRKASTKAKSSTAKKTTTRAKATTTRSRAKKSE